jgi:hypothetical protein
MGEEIEKMLLKDNPNWKGLGHPEKAHMRAQRVVTVNDLLENRRVQRAHNCKCFPCEMVAKKLGLEK